MEIRENLELVSVEYENNENKAIMTFLDRERKEVRQVNWNLQSFNSETKKWYNDDEKAEKIQARSQEIFGVDFASIENCVGTLHDVYLYTSFNSLYPVDVIEKFSEDMVGQVFQTEVKDVVVGDYSINITYEIDGKTYQSKHTFGTYLQNMKEWFVDPNKKAKVYDKFLEKYGVPVENAGSLVGHPLMVEVKSAFGNNYYGDIKKFPKMKK